MKKDLNTLNDTDLDLDEEFGQWPTNDHKKYMLNVKKGITQQV